MKRTFTTSFYFLLSLLFGSSLASIAHKAIDKPSNELPNFVSPHLFTNAGKSIKAPFKAEENIISWGDAIAKGLPILKIGGVGMSYNDFIKKGGLDSVRIDEGGVDCIKYRISKAKDSIAIGEEFELTVTAEYIDNIPFSWQNRECGDFCIKVFMPEGFVQTGGDYRDFEGFSLRPDGLKRIERKIKGYFESKPQNNCFMLTKGAKYYDPQYLLEVKQNYCFDLQNKEIINSYIDKNPILKADKNEDIISNNLDKQHIILQKSVTTDCSSISNFKPVITTPNGSTDFCIQTFPANLSTSCPNNSTAYWYTNNYSTLIQVESGIDNITASNGGIEGSIYVVCKDNSGCCFSKISSIVKARTNPLTPGIGSLYSIKKGQNRSFYYPESANELKIKTLNGEYNPDNTPIPSVGTYKIHYQQACNSPIKYEAIVTESELSLHTNPNPNPAFETFKYTISTTNNLINNGETTTITANNCLSSETIEWYKNNTKLPETTKNISVWEKGTYYSKCKYTGLGSRTEDISNDIIITFFESTPTTTTINKSINNCETVLTASCTNGGTFESWQFPNGDLSYSNPLTASVNGTYTAKCRTSTCFDLAQQDVTLVTNSYLGNFNEVSCSNKISGNIYNTLDLSENPTVQITIKQGSTLIYSKSVTTSSCGGNISYKCFEIPASDYLGYLQNVVGSMTVYMKVVNSPTCIANVASEELCCNAGTVTINSNSPVSVGGTLNMDVTSDNLNLTKGTITWSGPLSYTSSGRPTSLSSMTTAKAGVYSVLVSNIGNCPNAYDNETVVVIDCPSSEPLNSNLTLLTNGNNVTTYVAYIGQKITLVPTLSITVPANELSYKWKFRGSYIEGATNATLEITTFVAADAGQYTVEVLRAGCLTVAQKTVNITYGSCPAVTIFADGDEVDKEVYSGTVITLTANLASEQPPAGITYQWKKFNGTNFENASGVSNTANYSAGSVGRYMVEIKIGTSCTMTDEINITSVDCPTITSLKINNVEVATYKPDLYSTVTLSTSISNTTGVSFQWQKDGVNINGATSSTYTINSFISASAGVYKVVITKLTCTDVKQVTLPDPVCPTVIADAWINTNNHYTKTVYAKVGDNLDYSASLSGGTYLWTVPTGTHTFKSSSKTNLTINDSGRYSVTVTIGGCTVSDYFDLIVTCFDPIVNQAKVYNSGLDVGSTAIVSVGDNVSLFAPYIAGASYTWTGPNGFVKYERNPQISLGYITQAATGTYNLTVTKNGCSQNASVSITIGCPALSNVNVYSNSPNCQVRTGETLHLWVDKDGGNYTYNWSGPANFASTWRATGKDNVTGSYSGIYTVSVGYTGCTNIVTLTTSVCIFNCTLGTAITKTCNTTTGNGSITATAIGTTAPRQYSFYIERQNNLGQYVPVPISPGSTTNITWTAYAASTSYTFANVPSGIYKIYAKLYIC